MRAFIDIFLHRDSFEALLLVLIPVTLVAGVAGGWIAGRLTGRDQTLHLVRGGILGLTGVGAYGMWWVYNGMIGVYGLDTVKMFRMNLALFVTVGVAVGVGGGYLDRFLISRFGDNPKAGDPPSGS